MRSSPARSRSAAAEEIAVGNYGVSANGMPFGVALAKGYFKEEGLNITGLISSAGGGTSLRNMLAGGGVPYGEVNPGVVVSAILAGADLKIISDNVLTVAEFVWAVKPESLDQVGQGLQGQEDRLHQSALDEPGARANAAAGRRVHRSRRRAREDGRLRRRASPRSIRARSTSRRSPSRCGRRSSTSTAPSSSRAKCCRRSTTSSA